MRSLTFDTETTGLPKTKIISPDTLHLWPRIVQFSCIIYDTEIDTIVETKDNIVKMGENVIIPQDSTNIHGITNEMSSTNGIPIEKVLLEFFHHLQTVDKLIGHNISFDINMVKVELLRLIYSDIPQKEKTIYKNNLHYLTNFKNIFCTLQNSIELCNILATDRYGKEYLKYPKLTELHQKLFNIAPNNLHNSLNDIIVTLRCFMKMEYNKDIVDMTCEKNRQLYNNVFGLLEI